MPEFVRVKDKATGHEYSLLASKFDAEKYTKVDRPAVDSAGSALPAKHKTTVSTEAAKKSKTSGQQAASDKENS